MTFMAESPRRARPQKKRPASVIQISFAAASKILG
jgi:hypothetical protein